MMRVERNMNASMRTVLVVDDERVVRGLMRRYLERTGWCVLESESAERALELVGQSGVRIDLVFCDLNLPGLSGSALCGRITALRPDLASRLVLTSGDPDAAAEELARESLHCPVLEKPFTLVDLERVTGRALLVA
jgi:two-component system cell cycle sensor histidine kinase/response regulator CckA